MKFEEVLPALREGKILKCAIRDVVLTISSSRLRRGATIDGEMILDGVWEIEKRKEYARMYLDKGFIKVRMKRDLSLEDSYNEWLGDWVEIPEGTS